MTRQDKTCRATWRCALVVMCAALFVVALGSPATAGAAPRYPDLRPLTPVHLHLDTEMVSEQNHYVVRFTNVVWNAGEGPFELHGTPHFPVDGLFDASQWIYDDAGVQVEQVGVFAYHPSHSHFHFDGFARYELWRKRDFDRAQARGFASSTPLHVSPKVSFCVMDLTHVQPEVGPGTGVYRTCTPVLEGISQGWGDIYYYDLPDQWVDVGERPLPDGEYVIRTIADPDNIVFESAGKADPSRESQVANSATVQFSIVNGRLPVAP